MDVKPTKWLEFDANFCPCLIFLLTTVCDALMLLLWNIFCVSCWEKHSVGVWLRAPSRYTNMHYNPSRQITCVFPFPRAPTPTLIVLTGTSMQGEAPPNPNSAAEAVIENRWMTRRRNVCVSCFRSLTRSSMCSLLRHGCQLRRWTAGHGEGRSGEVLQQLQRQPEGHSERHVQTGHEPSLHVSLHSSTAPSNRAALPIHSDSHLSACGFSFILRGYVSWQPGLVLLSIYPLLYLLHCMCDVLKCFRT